MKRNLWVVQQWNTRATSCGDQLQQVNWIQGARICKWYTYCSKVKARVSELSLVILGLRDKKYNQRSSRKARKGTAPGVSQYISGHNWMVLQGSRETVCPLSVLSAWETSTAVARVFSAVVFVARLASANSTVRPWFARSVSSPFRHLKYCGSSSKFSKS